MNNLVFALMQAVDKGELTDINKFSSELCERIEGLEKRITELEAEKAVLLEERSAMSMLLSSRDYDDD